MEQLKLNLDHIKTFITESELSGLQGEALDCLKKLEEGTGEGSEFTGWLHLPSTIAPDLVEDIKSTARSMHDSMDTVILIGIGGSYLGARAIISALSHQFPGLPRGHKDPLILYAGHNIAEDYLHELLEVLDSREYGIIIISKSGTTTEPALAFRIIKNHLEKKYGPEKAAGRIIAVTDKHKGALRTLADRSGYESFIIPDDTGGRYSALTPVGLLPVAAAGFDIDQLLEGARAMEKATRSGIPFAENPAAVYAAARNLLYRKGYKIEILANYDNRLLYFSEWWKQLFAESEGKNQKGIFLSSVTYTTDLHSMGQYIQEGERSVFETVISIRSHTNQVPVPGDQQDLDQLNYLSGKRIDYVNKMAELGTLLAHVDGGVPNIHIEIPVLSEYYLGALIYFFEKACAISGYMLGINPFNQPGVEAYKKNMFALLEKPGFEEETRKMNERMG
jgi:glucose-6-phosphate isomerase